MLSVRTLSHSHRRIVRTLVAPNRGTLSLSKRSATSNSGGVDRIEIPNRIHRGPVDILNALSATIGTDPTAAHYKYHDDPYLIPTSTVGKRTYAMAQEAGRKAARWICQEHPELFQVRYMQAFKITRKSLTTDTIVPLFSTRMPIRQSKRLPQR